MHLPGRQIKHTFHDILHWWCLGINVDVLCSDMCDLLDHSFKCAIVYVFLSLVFSLHSLAVSITALSLVDTWPKLYKVCVCICSWTFFVHACCVSLSLNWESVCMCLCHCIGMFAFVCVLQSLCLGISCMTARCDGSIHWCYNNTSDTVSGVTPLSSGKHPIPTLSPTLFAA